MGAFDVQKHWQSMDWHMNWNIASVRQPLYRHFHMFLLVIDLDLEMMAAVVDSLAVESIVAAHMFRMYHQFVRKPIVSVWLAMAVENPMLMMMMMMHAVQLKLKLKNELCIS